jgi:hypothetical protein
MTIAKSAASDCYEMLLEPIAHLFTSIKPMDLYNLPAIGLS